MKNQQPIERFWQAYLDSLPPEVARPAHYEAWGFGDDAEMADELGALVIDGVKTATCSLLWVYETSASVKDGEPEPLPAVGDYSVILCGTGKPIGIIETTEIIIRPYNEVDAAFAYDEGEGDRSLAYWRWAHWCFFSRQCAQIGNTVAEEMPLVCERFRLVWL